MAMMGLGRSRTTRPREARTPLLEEEARVALRRRGAELAGLVLIALAGALVAALATYDPRDPSLFSATDARPTNALGLAGALAADPLFRALGWAAYALPLILGAWGLRLVLHHGTERILTRLMLAPLAIPVAAVFASAHVPMAGWPHAYGLGGLVGDGLLLSFLSLLPLPIDQAVLTGTLILAAAFVPLAGLVLGLDWGETRALLRGLGRGLLTAAAGGLALMRLAAGTAGAAASLARDRRRAARARGEPVLSRGAAAGTAPAPEPEAAEAPVRDEDRVVARIADAVRRRGLGAGAGADEEAEAPEPDLPAAREATEPPLTARPPERPEPLVRQSTPKPRPSTRAQEEAQPRLALDEPMAEDTSGYEHPPLALLQSPATIVRQQLSSDALEANARMLETVLEDYGVRGDIVSVKPGPVVTMYELEPAAGLKASRVIGLSDDIARSMSALAARVSTIPGRSVIGIELPNDHREKVLLRELLAHRSFGDGTHKLPLALGKDISGEPVIANLSKMPHLLIAGTTGSGKSVSINTMILSLLYKLSPEQCRLIMIDPKMLELSVYDGIPHLLSPVVTDPKKAVVALKWVVAEMEERYRKMSRMGVRNIDGYNGRVTDALARGEGFTRTVQTGFDDETGEPVFETQEYAPEKLPYIVVIVDEMADLMMVAGKEIEACIQRLAQMARASGIHLIMATQRPSVDVITGTIKANFPTRISFQVTSKIDSRTILGEQGAEQLLGMGDMLYMAGGGRITRIHAPFVSDEEVEEVVGHLKAQGEPDYVSGVQEGPEADAQAEIDQVLGLGGNTGGEDALYDQAVAIAARDRKCSTSYIQRKLGIGYNKAARLVEQMEAQGVVSAANQVGKREVLVPEA